MSTQHDMQFGVCPKCGVADGYIRTRAAVWFVCQVHKLRWRADYRCASWTADDPEPAPFQKHWSTERVWNSRDEMLLDYTEVEPRPARAR